MTDKAEIMQALQRVSRECIVGFLEDCRGMQCYDSETDAQLRRAAAADIEGEDLLDDFLSYAESFDAARKSAHDKLSPLERRAAGLD